MILVRARALDYDVPLAKIAAKGGLWAIEAG